ncbi:LacI family DNA-binding transcriptional regulator [Streptosporangium sp. NPDC000095]|uniref:LacI family DNA-binding transcriptional regulator n=1 Tax=Streptosporangium sp. NPDC000095 TaxID=3366184 RepID=UPI00367A4A26
MAAKVTITDVARRAGVSRQTVSNVLNSPELVREETRDRVREAIETLGYRASQAARQMRTGRSRLIATRIEPDRDGINGSVLDRFLHGLTASAARAGYRILLYAAGDERTEIDTFDELVGSHEPDAFVLTSTYHGDGRPAWLRERRLPFVTFGRPWGDAGDAADGDAASGGTAADPGYPWVDVDGAAGTAAATRHLLDAGHRRIGFLGWPRGSGVGDDRRSGWARTLAAAGIDPAGLDQATDDGVADGEKAARELLRAERPITALVCASDSLALGALHAVRSLTASGQLIASGRLTAEGRLTVAGRAGDEEGLPVSVIGFDDTPVARAVGLSSVSQPLAEAAAGCVGLLTRLFDPPSPGDPGTSAASVISAASHTPEAGAHLLLQPSLVLRQSSWPHDHPAG